MRAAEHRYFDTRFAALAHRGGASEGVPLALENTLPAFAAAVALGYRYLETDVHVTADGTPVAFHDEHLDRVTDAAGAISSFAARDLARVLVGGLERVPTLGELLEAFPTARFNLDLKADASVEAVARALDAHAAHDRVCVGSFSTSRLRRFRRLVGPRVATAVSPAGIAAYASPGVRRLGALDAGAALQVPTRHRGVPVVTRGLVAAAHAAGRVVHVWTINDADEMDALIDLGVDGLVSDDLVTLKAVLTRRNLWEAP